MSMRRVPTGRMRRTTTASSGFVRARPLHIVETVTLDADALSVLGTAEKLGLEWLATGERFDPAVPLWIAPVEGFCLPQRWVEYARRTLPDYTEADEKWLAKYRVP